MKVLNKFYTYIIISSVVLIVSNIYYLFKFVFPYNSFSNYLLLQFLLGFFIQGLFIYLSLKKKNIVFILLFINGYFIYAPGVSPFVLLNSAITNFNPNILLNLFNPIVAIAAILYWIYDANFKRNHHS